MIKGLDCNPSICKRLAELTEELNICSFVHQCNIHIVAFIDGQKNKY
jgi:hypothetical protein